MDNIQNILNRIRSPRVQITYDVETNGAKKKKEIPYITAILANLKGDSPKIIPYPEKKFFQLTGQNINNLMEFFEVKCQLSLMKFKTKDEEMIDMGVPFHSIHDFHPDKIIDNIPLLNELKNNLLVLKDLKRKVLSSNIFCQSLLTAINNKKFKDILNESWENNDVNDKILHNKTTNNKNNNESPKDHPKQHNKPSSHGKDTKGKE